MSALWFEVLLQTQPTGFQVLGVSGVVDIGPSHVQSFKPFPEHVECHGHVQIVKELKDRDEYDMIIMS